MKSLHVFLFSAILLIPLCGASPIPGHPRLLVSDKDWERLPSRMEADPAVAEVISTCISRADAILGKENLTYKLTGRRMLSVSRNAIERILDLSAAWKVTSERKYLERCRTELLGLSAMKDWHPSHHLDTAEMQTAVAIGYDWLYADLQPAERAMCEKALRDKALRPATELYADDVWCRMLATTGDKSAAVVSLWQRSPFKARTKVCRLR